MPSWDWLTVFMFLLIHLRQLPLNYCLCVLYCSCFMQDFPSSSWKKQLSDTPVQIIKTILHCMTKIKGYKILSHLSRIDNLNEPELQSYLIELVKVPSTKFKYLQFPYNNFERFWFNYCCLRWVFVMYDVKTLSIMKVNNSKHAKSTWIFSRTVYINLFSLVLLWEIRKKYIYIIFA
jgi:hypothetical protein